jgi:hypothetical protein
MAFELISAVVGAFHDGGTEDDPGDRGTHEDKDESSDVPKQAVNLPEIDVGIPKCKDSAEREALLLRELGEKHDLHACHVKHGRVSGETRHIERKNGLRPHHPLHATRFGAGVSHVIVLAVKADDEHGASVAIADGLVGGEDGRISALGRGIADALAETAVTKFVSTAKEFDGKVGVVRSYHGLHGAVMLVAKGQKVRPHAK